MLAALEGMITELRQIGVPISLSEKIDAVRSLHHLPLAERDVTIRLTRPTLEDVFVAVTRRGEAGDVSGG